MFLPLPAFKKYWMPRSFSSLSVLSKHILVLLEKEEINANGAGKSLTSSGPLSECPGANLNHFYSKQLEHLLKTGYSLACPASVYWISVYNGVHQSKEWDSMFIHASFQIALFLQTLHMYISAQPACPLPYPMTDHSPITSVGSDHLLLTTWLDEQGVTGNAQTCPPLQLETGGGRQKHSMACQGRRALHPITPSQLLPLAKSGQLSGVAFGVRCFGRCQSL